MMWHPFKAAFRAGGTDDGAAGDYWNDNRVGFYSWAGGNLSVASAFATFAFGDQVEVTGVDAAGFGGNNTVSGTAGFSTGASNRCTGFACVAMGFTNTASGQGSVALGYRVTADADYAISFGRAASANGHSGSFNIADFSTTDSLEASANNQFNSRYAGGYRLYSNATMTTGQLMNAGGSSWNVISDQAMKEAFEPLDGEEVLLKLRNVPVMSWRYIDEAKSHPDVRHIGPMAQDWHHVFDLSSDKRTINQGDFDGVNLAGVKALDARTVKLMTENEDLKKKVNDLEKRLAEIEKLLQKK
jgi:hypothetical protein